MMGQGVEVEERHVTTIEVDGRRYVVSVAITFDGVEHIGKLWYHEESFLDDEGIRDRSAIPGRTADEVTARARALAASELTLRLRRAWADQRRHHGLRRTTLEILDEIRELNKIGTSLRAGMLDAEQAARALDSTEERLHDLVKRLRTVAGVEG
jgi:hypothetical protein